MIQIRQHLQLQFKMIQRHIADFGIHPFIGFTIIGLLFYIISFEMFKNVTYAPIVYPCLAIMIAFRLSESNRNSFLKQLFEKETYQRIRITENLLVILPFFIFLLFKFQFISAGILLIASIIVSYFETNSKTGITTPTPFSKFPFEFIVGFRKTFFVFIISYSLILFSIMSANFNLGMFAILLIFLSCISFYVEVEDVHFIWIYNLNVNNFLFHKIRTAIICSSIAILPMAISMFIFFSDSAFTIIIFLFVGYLYLVMMIIAKYSNFPRNISLPNGILFVLGMIIPLFLFFTIPYFIRHSREQLKPILE